MSSLLQFTLLRLINSSFTNDPLDFIQFEAIADFYYCCECRQLPTICCGLHPSEKTLTQDKTHFEQVVRSSKRQPETYNTQTILVVSQNNNK